jgi:hypothetical protein
LVFKSYLIHKTSDSTLYPVLSRRVPEVLAGIARRGAAWMPLVAGGTGSKRRPDRLFFGFFLLAKQKKETRLWAREPTLEQTVALATQNNPTIAQ